MPSFFGMEWRMPRLHIKNRSIKVLDITDLEERKKTLYDDIDKGRFQRLVVWTAGIGFFTDAYNIFAVNLTAPMIGHVYYKNARITSGSDAALRCSTLVGTIFGQITFGFFADLYGRRKMYGLELLIIIVATIGVAMASNGAEAPNSSQGSMDIMAWLITWRFILGYGIGADYPLSAIMTSEFAPTKHRGRMLAAVFYTQPLGYLAAIVVSLGVTFGYRHSMTVAPGHCMDDYRCRSAVDSCWRWIIGVGTVPALIAILFRITVPESPRYTADILNRPEEAKYDMQDLVEFDEETETTGGSPLTLRYSVLPDPAFSANPQDDPEAFSYRWRKYWESFNVYFIQQGHWRTLLGTSLAWLLLDGGYYSLGANSMKVNPKIFNMCSQQKDNAAGDECNEPGTIYQDLIQNSWHSLIVVSIGSILGGAGMIKVIKHQSPRTLQIWGFLALSVLFIAVGVCLVVIKGENVTYPTSTLYVLCQIFFEIGPNFTTFIIPAEFFKTEHRAFAHGISAATGKVGAVLFQIFFQYVKFRHHSYNVNGTVWLGYTVICFAPTMFLGAVVTKYLIPESRNPANHKESRPLEELERVREKLPEEPVALNEGFGKLNLDATPSTLDGRRARSEPSVTPVFNGSI